MKLFNVQVTLLLRACFLICKMGGVMTMWQAYQEY